MDKKIGLILIFMTIFNSSWGKLEDQLPTMFGAQGSELLKELKEAGVIDQFEQELEKLLHEQKTKGETNEIETEATEEEQPEANPVAEFIESYVEAKEITLDPRILEHLSALPISDEGEAKHFVHLTQVLDKIYKLATLDDPEVDKKVLEVIKRVKSLPIMKTSLNKLGDATEEPVVQKEKEQVPPSQNDLIDQGVLTMIVDFIRNIKKKPEFLLEVLLPMVEESGLVGKDVVKTIRFYGDTFVRSPSFANYVDGTADYIESIAKSQFGMRLIQLIPQIMQHANDKEKLMEVFKAEAEGNWNQLVGRMENSDFIEAMVTHLAGSVVSTHGFFKSLLKDDMKMAIGNTFLISQGLPSVKPRKLTESLFDLADKCIKVFTVYKIELEQYKTETLKQIAMIEKEYISALDYGKLNEQEQKVLIARFLRENMVEPFQHLFNINTFINEVEEGEKCLQSLLCNLNKHMKDQGPIKSEAAKIFSMAASFAWTIDEDEEESEKLVNLTHVNRWKLYKSIWNGHNPEQDCSVLYPPPGKENICHILPWQSDVMMSLNFEHTEL